jgi:hypothetical protein
MICRACKSDVSPSPPRAIGKVVTLGYWVAAMATSTVFSLLLGLNVVLVPLWLAIGMAVGVAARRASTWTCPRCKEEMAPPIAIPDQQVVEAPSAPSGTLQPRPA